SMVGEVSGVLHTVACFVPHLLGRRIRTIADQRMKLLSGIPRSRRVDRVVLYPVALALERIGGQWLSSPRSVGMHGRPIDLVACEIQCDQHPGDRVGVGLLTV